MDINFNYDIIYCKKGSTNNVIRKKIEKQLRLLILTISKH